MGESARNSPSTSAAAAAAGAVHAFLGDDHDDRRGGTHDGGPAARKRILCAPFHPGRTSDGNNHERRPFGCQQTQGRSLAHGAFASLRGVFGGFPIRAHRPDGTGQTHHREPPGLGPVGTPGRVPGTRRPLVLQGTGGTGQPGICRGLLRRVARIRRRYGQRPAPRRDHFLLPVRVRAGILRLSDGDRGRGGRPVQDATAGGIFDAGGDRRLAGGLCVGDEGIRGLYRTVHCSAETRPGGVPRLVFLHLFGVADLFVLSFVALRCVSFSSDTERNGTDGGRTGRRKQRRNLLPYEPTTIVMTMVETKQNKTNNDEKYCSSENLKPSRSVCASSGGEFLRMHARRILERKKRVFVAVIYPSVHPSIHLPIHPIYQDLISHRTSTPRLSLPVFSVMLRCDEIRSHALRVPKGIRMYER